MPYANIIKIIIKQEDTDKRWVKNTKGQPITLFQLSSLNLCYKYLNAENNLDVDWFETFVKEINKLALMKIWSIVCKIMRSSSYGLYKTKILR